MINEKVLDITDYVEYLQRVNKKSKQDNTGAFRVKTLQEYLERDSANRKKYIYVTSSGTFKMGKGLIGVL